MKVLILNKSGQGRFRFYWGRMIILLSFILLSQDAAGQIAEDWKSNLSSKLESEAEHSHLHLVGYFNELLFAEMFFAHDTADWVGFLWFPELSLRYDLEGMVDSDKLFFNEFDSTGKQTGYWTIEKRRNEFQGKWQNIDQNMDFEILMFDEFWNPDFQKDYYKKCSSYAGLINGVPYQFEIKRKHGDPVDMEWFDQESFQSIPVEWACEDAFCRKFKLARTGQEGWKGSQAMTAHILNDRLEWKLSEDEKEKENLIFKLEEERYTQIEAKSDERSLFVVEYPVFEEKNGIRRMEVLRKNLLDSLRNEVEKLDSPVGSGDRWEHFAHAWFELNFWDDQFLSGKWIVQRNWTDEKWTIPINFEIRENRVFDIKNEFKSGFDLEFFLDHFIQLKVKELPEYRDPLSRNKLTQEKFENITFSRSGILLSSDFDTIFGTFRLVIPYEEVEPYLRKRSSINKMLERRKND